MFHTATRTATRSFVAAMTAWSDSSTDWFDGTVGSVDDRLRRCGRLLATANASVGRGELDPYLGAIGELSADREAIASLREELLTSGPGRGVTGVSPSGRTASLSPQSKRWVELEATRFLRANLDVAHVGEERDERARRYAAENTSTFPDPQATTQAFVARVAALGDSLPRMRTASAPPPSQDFDDTALFL